jgi:hypothetical protein
MRWLENEEIDLRELKMKRWRRKASNGEEEAWREESQGS